MALRDDLTFELFFFCKKGKFIFGPVFKNFMFLLLKIFFNYSNLSGESYAPNSPAFSEV